MIPNNNRNNLIFARLCSPAFLFYTHYSCIPAPLLPLFFSIYFLIGSQFCFVITVFVVFQNRKWLSTMTHACFSYKYCKVCSLFKSSHHSLYMREICFSGFITWPFHRTCKRDEWKSSQLQSHFEIRSASHYWASHSVWVSTEKVKQVFYSRILYRLFAKKGLQIGEYCSRSLATRR